MKQKIELIAKDLNDKQDDLGFLQKQIKIASRPRLQPSQRSSIISADNSENEMQFEEVKVVPGTEGNFRRQSTASQSFSETDADETGLSSYNDENGINGGDLSKSVQRR